MSLLALVGLSSCACCVCVCVFVCVCEAGNNRSLLRLYQASFDTCAMRRRTNMGSCLLFDIADTVSLTRLCSRTRMCSLTILVLECILLPYGLLSANADMLLPESRVGGCEGGVTIDSQRSETRQQP